MQNERKTEHNYREVKETFTFTFSADDYPIRFPTKTISSVLASTIDAMHRDTTLSCAYLRQIRQTISFQIQEGSIPTA